MKPLLEQFNEIKLLPLLEIEYGDGEFEIYHIMADDIGLHAGDICNTGFLSRGITVEWDDNFSLDENLQALYDACYYDAMQ
jgi:hypothetical protein